MFIEQQLADRDVIGDSGQRIGPVGSCEDHVGRSGEGDIGKEKNEREEEEEKKERQEVKETPGYANTNTKKPARLLRCVLRGKIAMSLL